MMKDLPGQTKEMHEADMEILHSMGYSLTNIHRSYQVSACVPFPGTKLYEDLIKNNTELSHDYVRYDGAGQTVMEDVNKQWKQQ
jgi:radical SAM superfamily enzyme YgiQ (UPF0313 family)